MCREGTSRTAPNSARGLIRSGPHAGRGVCPRSGSLAWKHSPDGRGPGVRTVNPGRFTARREEAEEARWRRPRLTPARSRHVRRGQANRRARASRPSIHSPNKPTTVSVVRQSTGRPAVLTFAPARRLSCAQARSVPIRSRLAVVELLDRWVLPEIGNMDVVKIGPRHVQAVLDKVVAAGKAPEPCSTSAPRRRRCSRRRSAGSSSR